MAVDANGNVIPADEPVKFDEKQQEKVNQLIQQKMGEAAATVRAELATTKAAMEKAQTELAAAKEALEKAKTPNDRKGAKEDVEALQATIAEMKNASLSSLQEIERLQTVNKDFTTKLIDAKQEAVNIRKEAAITKAATACGFVDPSEVAALTSKIIKYDDTKGRFIVMGENGQERLNAAAGFEPMTLEEFYTEYAVKKPHLVRADARGGIGASESQRSGLGGAGSYKLEDIFGPKSDSKKANKLALENKKEYQRIKQLAVAAGLIS